MYAQNTEVPVEKSQRHIEDLVTAAGASSFMRGTDEQGKVVVAFKMKERRIMFEMPPAQIPPPPKGRRWKDPELARRDAERSKWRALFLCIKAKLVGVDAGVETFDEAFLPHIVVAGNDGRAQRFSAMAIKAITDTYKSGGPPQLMLGDGK